MATTTAFDVTSSAWTNIFTAGASTLTVGIWNHANDGALLRVGPSDPGAGDAAVFGSIPLTRERELTLDNNDKVWCRLQTGTGKVTVLG